MPSRDCRVNATRTQPSIAAVDRPLDPFPEHADLAEEAFALLDATTAAETILYVTVTDGNDAYVY